MKKIIPLFTAMLLLSTLLSCKTTYHGLPYAYSKDIPQKPFTATKYESRVLSYINELRRDPKRFYQTYLKDYIKGNSSYFSTRYTSSLRKTLLNTGQLPPLKNSAYLQPIAEKQLHYLTRKLKGKRLQHNQGTISFSERIKGRPLSRFAENLYRAKNTDPLKVVLDLLIDQGVPSFGHRKNLLSTNYDLISIQSAKAPNNYIITVIDFGKK